LVKSVSTNSGGPGRRFTLLVVDDEKVLTDTITYTMRREGYHVLVVHDGELAVKTARADRPDLIILDIMLPKVDGFDVCRLIRRESDVPILILTARESEADVVLGLELGADDYMTKPFSMRELTARVKAMLRRSATQHSLTDGVLTRPVLQAGPLRIDQTQHKAEWDGRPLELRPKEFDLLLFMARHPGVVHSRDLLLERVWGYQVPVDTRTVDVHVRWLREHIEPDPGQPRYLQTVRGVGYRFVL